MNERGTYRLAPMAAVVLIAEAIGGLLLLLGWWYLHQEPGARLARPWALYGLLAGPLMVLVFLLHARWRRRALLRFAMPPDLERMVPGVSGGLTVLRFLFLRHGITLLVLALAGPQQGEGAREITAEGIDLIVAVDVSNSMDCADIHPSRMKATANTLQRLVDRLRGDRIGVVVFAGEAFTQLPITADRSAARMVIDGLDTRVVATQGTFIGSAIGLAVRSFDPESPAGRAIVVISDGEDHDERDENAIEAARAARDKGIVVHTLGVGTPQGGPIPIMKGRTVVGYRKDRAGNSVITKLNEELLRAIAAAGGGTYQRATGTGDEISGLFEQFASLDRAGVGTYRFDAYHEYFEYPLTAGLVLCLLGLSTSERRRKRRTPWTAWLPLALVIFTSCGDAHERRQRFAMLDGQHHHDRLAYLDAALAYREALGHPWARHNLAATYQGMDLLDSAVLYFEASTRDMTDTAGLLRAWYGTANANLRLAARCDTAGRETLELLHGMPPISGDVRERLRLTTERDSLRQRARDLYLRTDSALVRAVKAYEQVLRLDAADEEARHDLAVAQRWIARRRGTPPDNPRQDDPKDQALTERARLLIAKADTLVEEHRFKAALDVLQEGLRQEPSLKQRKDYMDKLNTVNEAAEAARTP